MNYKDLAVNPVTVVLQLVGAKWKILVVKELLKKEMRFVELKKNLGCTAKVLTSCLKEMEEDGLIIREVDEKEVNKVEITQILQTEKDPSVRRKAYEAKIKGGDLIAEDLIELIKMRNKYALKKISVSDMEELNDNKKEFELLMKLSQVINLY